MLVPDVQVGGGLIEKHNSCLLSENHGEPCSLLLPAGEILHPCASKFAQVRTLQGLVDGPFVRFAPLP